MKEINFIKAEACGNDFIILDRFGKQRPKGVPSESEGKPVSKNQISKLAKELCRRKLSVGADGLVMIESSNRADFKMRIFNPDGTEVDMCGNGARCLALYAAKEKICSERIVIETRAGDLQAEVKQDKVKIKMPRPKDLKLKFDLNIDGQTHSLNYINTGVPHVVCFVQGLSNFDVKEMGGAIRYHPEFQPEGANADFVEVLDRGHIKVRTYERGVEQETLACGTGAVAASIITSYQMRQLPQGPYKIKVDTQGGEVLTVYFNIKKDIIEQVFLEGQAKIVYKGKALV